MNSEVIGSWLIAYTLLVCCISSLATRSKLISSMSFLWMWENMMLFKWFYPLFELTQVFCRLMTLKLRSQDDVWLCDTAWAIDESLPTFTAGIALNSSAGCKSFEFSCQCRGFHKLMETSPTLPAHLPRWRQRRECFWYYEGIPGPRVKTIRHSFSIGSNIFCRLEGTFCPPLPLLLEGRGRLPPAPRSGVPAPVHAFNLISRYFVLQFSQMINYQWNY